MVITTDPTGALKFSLTFFTVCGLWRPDNKFAWLYIVYATIFQIIFLFCYVGFKCANFLFLTDPDMIIKELYICCSELSLVVKVINFHYYQKEMKKFLVNIKSFELLSVEEQDLLNRRLSKFKFLLAFQLICCVTAIIFSCGTPLFAKNTLLPWEHLLLVSSLEKTEKSTRISRLVIPLGIRWIGTMNGPIFGSSIAIK